MGQIVLAAAGAVVGSFIPGVGAALGWAAGSAIGSAVIKPKPINNVAPMLTDLRVTGTEYGQMIPYVIGHPRISGQIWYASSKRAVPHTTTTEAGGKGGGGQEVNSTTYTYEVDLLIGLTDNHIQGVTRVWSDGKLIYSTLPLADAATIAASADTDMWASFTVYDGTQTAPDPDYEAAVGTDYALAYIGRSFVFINSLNCGSNGQIPNLTFELGAGESGIDDDFASVAYLAHGEGADGSTTISDASVNNASQDTGTAFSGYNETDDFKFGAGSIYVNGGNSLRYPYIPAYFIGTGDFTHECFIKINAIGGSGLSLFGNGAVGTATAGSWLLLVTSLGAFLFVHETTGGGAYDTQLLGANGDVTVTGTWKHLVLQRESGFLSIYWDGTRVLHTAFSGSMGASDKFYSPIGSDDSTYTPQAYFDEIRFTVGIARYTGLSFTPPNAAFPGEGAGTVDEYELMTVPVDEAVSALCLRAGLDASEFDVTDLANITREIRGFAISEIAPTRASIETLASAYFFDCTVSDKIYFYARGGSSVRTFAHNEVGVSLDRITDSEPLELKVENEPEIPAQLLLTYPCFNQDYQPDTQPSDRIVTSLDESPAEVRLPLVMTPSEAKGVVDVMLLDQYIALLGTSVTVFGNANAEIEPTDVVTVTDQDGNTIRMRVTRRTDNYPLMTLDLVRDDASILTSQAIASASYTSSITVAAAADTEIVLLDIPLLRDIDDTPGFYAAAKGSTNPWPGCSLLRSVDDVSFTEAALFTESGVFGTCTTALDSWYGAHVFDEISSVRVNVGEGTLTSSTRAAILADSSENAFAIGAHGRWELGQFTTAELISSAPNIYKLTGLLRGRRGTEWAATGHLSSDEFVLLRMSGLRRIALSSAQLGVSAYYRGVTLGRKLSTATSETFNCEGVSQMPFAPVALNATRDSVTGDITLECQRRSRLDVRMIGTLGISVPSGEDSITFEWEILAVGSPATVIRNIGSTGSISNSVETVLYTTAQQAVDFGSPSPTSIRFAVYQVSADVGRGRGAEATITL